MADDSHCANFIAASPCKPLVGLRLFIADSSFLFLSPRIILRSRIITDRDCHKHRHSFEGRARASFIVATLA